MPHRLTNVGDKSFTVTWLTDIAEMGYVKYGTGAGSLDNTDYDDRGQATEDDTHHVTIIGLSAGTTYYYEIVSGGVIYNNDGVPYETTTGPTLQPQMPGMISSAAYKTGGVSAAEGAIVYANIGTSQVLSVLVDSNGAWAMNITPVRTADYQSYYTHSDSDDISLDADGGADGTTVQTMTIAEAKAGASDMALAVAAAAEADMSEKVVTPPPSSAQPAFTTSDLSIAPTEVSIGESVTITTQVTNTGDLEGTYGVALKIDDVIVESKQVTLAGGISEGVTFTTASDTAGTYAVTIDGLSQTFTVKSSASPVAESEPTKEMNWWLIIGGSLAGVLVLSVLIWQINKYRYG